MKKKHTQLDIYHFVEPGYLAEDLPWKGDVRIKWTAGHEGIRK